MYRICRNHFPSCNLIQVSHNFLGNWGRAGNLVIPNLSNSVIWTSKACGLLLIDTWINHCIATLFWSRWVVWVWLVPISLLLMCLSRGFLVLERPLTFHRQVLPDIIWELFIKYLPPILKGLGQKLLVAKHLLKNAAGEVSDQLCKRLSRSSRRLCPGTHQRLPRGCPPIIMILIPRSTVRI